MLRNTLHIVQFFWYVLKIVTNTSRSLLESYPVVFVCAGGVVVVVAVH